MEREGNKYFDTDLSYIEITPKKGGEDDDAERTETTQDSERAAV